MTMKALARTWMPSEGRVGRRRASRRAVTRPVGSASPVESEQPASSNAWQRILPDGTAKAPELWMKSKSKTPPVPPEEWQGVEPVHRVPNSDILASPKRTWMGRSWSWADLAYLGILGGLHVGALMAPFKFSWAGLITFLVLYVVTGCFGITFSYHRQLAHRSFKTPKWLEYFMAYCGVHALQGDPVVWVSSHRYHHRHTDTPNDPHTPYEGFWWSHLGWLLDNDATMQRVSDRSNANDLLQQPFYSWLSKTYVWHLVGAGALMLLLGGWSVFLWGFCLRAVTVYHITWAVNSVCHVWGKQEFDTGDLSRNNLLIGILAFGEGWHNNHHAFEFSARHGLKPWQIDFTYFIISSLQKLGLASNVKLPNEEQMNRMRLSSSAA